MPTVPALVTLRLTGKGEGTKQTVTPEGSPHAFNADTYRSFGGEESAPSPLSYSLGALTACMQITAGIVARDLDITLGRFHFELSAEFPPAVLATGAQGNPNFQSVTVATRVETDADAETFARLEKETERRCPITQLFARSGVRLSSRWTAEALSAAPAP